MANEQHIDKIEAWLQGKLLPSEAAAFQIEVDSDPLLAEEVELHRIALQAGAHFSEQHLQDNVLKWVANVETTSPIPQSNSKFWIWTTATLFLLLTVGTFWHFWQIGKVQQKPVHETLEALQYDSIITALRADFQQKNDSLQALTNLPVSAKDSILLMEIKRLRAEVEQKDRMLRDLETKRRAGKPLIAIQFAKSSDKRTRGADEGTDPTLLAEKKAFDAKDYTESIRLLKSIPAKDNRQEQVKQRLPYSLFYAKDYEAAIPLFLYILETDQYEEANAQWYLLLCYVATGQEAETRLMIHVILNSKNPKYYQNTTDLKKALNL